MNYAIEFLKKECEKLKEILSIWETNKLPVERKEREIQLKSLEKAISYLKSVESFNNSVEGKTIQL